MSKRAWREAEAAAARGAWTEAADLYAQIAEKAARVRDRAVARQAASAGADALRRDDRPAAAAKMLAIARANGQDSLEDRIQLAAVLLDAGELDAALDIATQARSEALLRQEPTSEVLARDAVVGIELALGRPEEARAELQAVAALGLPGSEISYRFRQAQLDRLDGLLSAAEASWRSLAALLSPHREAQGPMAGCLGELGELGILRASLGVGDRESLLRQAHTDLLAAAQGWRVAGRRAGLFRTEAWILRVKAMLGETVLPSVLDRAIAFASERGMPLLEADLLVSRALLRHDPSDAQAAVERLGAARLARGRARVVAAELGATVEWEVLFEELEGDAPWVARAMLASKEWREEGRRRASVMAGSPDSQPAS